MAWLDHVSAWDQPPETEPRKILRGGPFPWAVRAVALFLAAWSLRPAAAALETRRARWGDQIPRLERACAWDPGPPRQHALAARHFFIAQQANADGPRHFRESIRISKSVLELRPLHDTRNLHDFCPLGLGRRPPMVTFFQIRPDLNVCIRRENLLNEDGGPSRTDPARLASLVGCGGVSVILSPKTRPGFSVPQKSAPAYSVPAAPPWATKSQMESSWKTALRQVPRRWRMADLRNFRLPGKDSNESAGQPGHGDVPPDRRSGGGLQEPTGNHQLTRFQESQVSVFIKGITASSMCRRKIPAPTRSPPKGRFPPLGW